MYYFSKTLKIFKIKYNSMIVKMAKMKTDEQKVEQGNELVYYKKRK